MKGNSLKKTVMFAPYIGLAGNIKRNCSQDHRIEHNDQEQQIIGQQMDQSSYQVRGSTNIGIKNGGNITVQSSQNQDSGEYQPPQPKNRNYYKGSQTLSTGLFDKKTQRFLSTEQTHKLIALTFINHRQGVQKFRQVNDIQIDSSVYSRHYQAILKAIFNKIMDIYYNKVASPGSVLKWNRHDKQIMKAYRSWMSSYEIEIFYKVARVKYGIEENISQWQITQLYNALKIKLRENVPFKKLIKSRVEKRRQASRRLKRQEGTMQKVQRVLRVPRKIGTLLLEIAELLVVYKKEEMSWQRISKKHPEIDWMGMYIKMIVQKNKNKGLLMLMELASKFQRQVKHFPTLNLTKENMGKMLPRLENTKITSSMLRLTILNEPSPQVVAQAVRQMNNYLATLI